ncbi:MAG: GNAT family N-acetyltransferase [Clostridia bacterium]|nr:GNAT family N-acetyltransferase [Clostridia bacterium]
MSVEFVRMSAAHDPWYSPAMELYAQSFPHHEQRQAFSQAAIMADPAYHFYRIMDGDVFVGVILNWQADGFIYVEHFCIVPELRGCGYGRQALKLLAGLGKTVILEIDPPVDAVAVRRKHFYESVGYVENGFSHVHPPYHEGHKGHALVVMSCPHALDEAQYRAFYHYLCDTVMAGACVPNMLRFRHSEKHS